MSQQIVLGDLLDQMQACGERMSMTNPARRVLWIASEVLKQQSKQLAELRAAQAERAEPLIVIP